MELRKPPSQREVAFGDSSESPKVGGSPLPKGQAMSLRYDGDLIENARALRKNGTKQEMQLWYDFLGKYPLRFQRQKVIGSYIVDFYCHKAKLVIELDGSQHYEGNAKRYDAIRTEYLESLGLYVLRFLNSDVDCHFEGVCGRIDKTIKERIAAGFR